MLPPNAWRCQGLTHDMIQVVRTSVRSLVGIIGLVLLLWGPRAAGAQGEVEIIAPPPERPPRPEIFIPGHPPDITRPREQDFYADEIRVRHDPAFVVPFSTTISTGPHTAARFGLSGWTAPRGRGDLLVRREVPGWFALGFSFVWDIPIQPKKPGAAPPATTPR